MESIAGHLHNSRQISCCSFTFRLHRIHTSRVSARHPTLKITQYILLQGTLRLRHISTEQVHTGRSRYFTLRWLEYLYNFSRKIYTIFWVYVIILRLTILKTFFHPESVLPHGWKEMYPFIAMFGKYHPNSDKRVGRGGNLAALSDIFRLE